MALNLNNSTPLELNKDFTIYNLSSSDASKIPCHLRGKWNSFILIKGGNGILKIDFDEYVAIENKVFFIEKYKIWDFIRKNNMEGVIILFTDSFYNHIYTGNPKLKSDQTLVGEIPPFITIPSPEKKEWETVFTFILNEYSAVSRNSVEIICLMLKVLILMYRRNTNSGYITFESGHKKQLINEFRSLVNNRYKILRTARDYAGELNITPNYLNALCQEYFFKSVSEIIRERMILEAKRLLMHSKLNISEISYKLGFKDHSYFGRYFRRSVGITPKKFRSLHLHAD